MTIGIPRALLYFRYHALWRTFMEALGAQVVVSRETDKEILRRGAMYAIDEACLSSKIYLGHVESLLGTCDAVFVPRIANFGRGEILCTKFEALYDIVQNTFRDRKPALVDFEIDGAASRSEMGAFLSLGKQLGKKKANSLYAYMVAKQAEKMDQQHALEKQRQRLDRPGIKVLMVGHSYNLYDAFIGKPVLSYLRELGVTPILADVVDRRQAVERSRELTETLPWVYNQELVGAVQEYRDRVDGIILVSAFPCGPDSLVNEVLIRRVKDLPILNLLLDSQDGLAGVETRLESFIDIIRFKQEAAHAKA